MLHILLLWLFDEIALHLFISIMLFDVQQNVSVAWHRTVMLQQLRGRNMTTNISAANKYITEEMA